MGFFKNTVKVAGSAVLAATGVASTVVRGVCKTAGIDVFADLAGYAQNASFEKIRDIWTPDEQKNDAYYEARERRKASRSEAVDSFAQQERSHFERQQAEIEKKQAQQDKIRERIQERRG